MSSSLRDRWSTALLHLTAYLSRKKNELLVTHGFRGFLVVLCIIGTELLTLAVSLPSYLAARPTEVSEATKEYRLRRALTLGLLGALLILWLLKLLLIVFLTWQTGHFGALEITQTVNKKANTETAVADLLVAEENKTVPPPVISAVKTTHGQIDIQGKAPAGNGIIFSFMQKNKKSSAPPKVYSTWADTAGHFELVEDQNIFSLPTGAYAVSAMVYDPVKKARGTEAATFDIAVTESLSNRLFHSLDGILNILAVIVITLGLLATVLVT